MAHTQTRKNGETTEQREARIARATKNQRAIKKADSEDRFARYVQMSRNIDLREDWE